MNKHKILLFLLALVNSAVATAQIDLSDSSYTALAHWRKGDKMAYTITEKQYTVSGSDTTNVTTDRFLAEVLVKDSTADGYLIQWDFGTPDIDADNHIYLLAAQVLSADIPVLVRTDTYGMLLGIKNWKDISKHIIDKARKIEKDDKNNLRLGLKPAMENIVKAVATENDILLALGSITQFYALMGNKYTARKSEPIITHSLVTPNYTDTAETKTILWAEQIIPKMSAAMACRHSFSTMKNATADETISAYFHESGWLLKSLDSYKMSYNVPMGDVKALTTNVMRRKIELNLQ